ncbi:NAD(P)-dependent oxidoreductase [Leucobacter luti]|uniref:Putative NAD(P)-binding protein n=1 Tax=Leucobacter luti TaxID=340320 RepID=A0A4Q7U5L0_9MICO|nr:NAD(P)-binding oxidoreductase [Leucobacter luti]MBL3700736.1 NAD(P)-dependent oxidoreductase [Leucobacter luti]RZT68427.1 putative NAD(P)-binding protein [Leucobacter luti]
MKIVIVGAAGNVGSHTVTEALRAGHEVTAYVRRPERVAPRPGLTVVAGDATDTVALTAAATGADAVVVSITGSTKDATFMQRTLPSVIDAARAAGAGRLVLVSVFGAGDTAAKASGFARLVYRLALRRFLADKAAADAQLIASGLNYAIAYPVNLKQAEPLPETGIALLRDVDRVPGLPTLPYGNAAAALVEIATQPGYAGERVLVTTPTGWRAV